MTDEQRIALAHWKRLAMRIEDVPVTDRVANCLEALAHVAEAIMATSPPEQYARTRVLLALMAPKEE